MAIDFEPDSFFYINEQGGSNSTGSELKFIYGKCPTKTIKKSPLIPVSSILISRFCWSDSK